MKNATVDYLDGKRENFVGCTNAYAKDNIFWIMYEAKKVYAIPIVNVRRFLLEEVKPNENKEYR